MDNEFQNGNVGLVSENGYQQNWGHRDRRTSNVSSFSTSSIRAQVEMAQDTIFTGPLSTSVPSSIKGFHREWMATGDGDDILGSRHSESDSGSDFDVEQRPNGHRFHTAQGAGENAKFRVDEPSSPYQSMPQEYFPNDDEMALLEQRSSYRRNGSPDAANYRIKQRLRIDDDMTVTLHGFDTHFLGLISYACLCLCTFGLAYLVFRWFPKWRIRLLGRLTALRTCSWIVIEDCWGQTSIADASQISYGKSLSSAFGARALQRRISALDDEDDPVLPYLRSIHYRYHRLHYEPYEDRFYSCSDWVDPSLTNMKSIRQGLRTEQIVLRDQIFGHNELCIHQKPLVQLFLNEALHPFYVFQIASLTLWSFDQYYYYAACIFLISLFSICSTMLEMSTTAKRMQEISNFDCNIRVLRNGFWRQIRSNLLLPGDVFEISDPNLGMFPCDGLLLTGECIVNESMLTGESVPITKSPVTSSIMKTIYSQNQTINSDLAKYTFFAGTQLIYARRPLHDISEDEAVTLGLVLKTGFSTTKGSLLRSMLFPKPINSQIHADAFRFIGVMAIVAMLGFIFSFANFVRLGLSWHLIVIRALDIVTIVIPPALPATLTIGTNFALTRLKLQQVFCISPNRISLAGKIDLMFFDKTGTLTEDRLDVLGILPVNRRFGNCGSLLQDVRTLAADDSGLASEMRSCTHSAMLFCMSTCHSLNLVENTIIGDPLDVQMFEFTGWRLEEPQRHPDTFSMRPGLFHVRPPAQNTSSKFNSTNAPYSVIKRFDFTAHLRRTSVIAEKIGAKETYLFAKGAPESIRPLCSSRSIPRDFEEVLSNYTLKGYRIIACAQRVLPFSNYLRDTDRALLEKDLEFIGFIIFENKLKESSKSTIESLQDANIRTVMCTGDNILTAISVARQCSFLDPKIQCYMPFLEQGIRGDEQHLRWHDVDDDVETESASAAIEHSIFLEQNQIRQSPSYHLAMTGEVLNWIIKNLNDKSVKKILERTSVFARMSPDEKQILVRQIQASGICCGFCGDGANDCGALRAAEVGISLSEAEASVASPFTSQTADVSCVLRIIREGRSAAETGLCCFKYMSLYSAIQFASVSILYASASNLGDLQYLFIDICLVLPIAVFMSWAGPSSFIEAKKPIARLVSAPVLIPLFGQISLCILLQIFTLSIASLYPWYQPPVTIPDQSNIKNMQNTILFHVTSFQYLYIGLIINSGKPFREPVLHNYPFVATMVFLLTISMILLFCPGKLLSHAMQLTAIPISFKISILFFVLIGTIAAWLNEHFICAWLMRRHKILARKLQIR